MSFKSLIAAAAVAASLAGVSATQAQAGLDIDIFVGGPGFVVGGGHGHGFVGIDLGHAAGISCNKGRKIVKWNGYHNVNTIECDGSTYTYKGKRFGDYWKVRVNRWSGNIVSVSLI